ncbi:MAG: GNAT family N-acetyltransferase [Chitinophagales bacterium]|nr:GNAT family N-acetyltransferase [Chitinophagales bacterium]
MAEPADIPTILSLIRELANFERQPDAVILSESEMERAIFGEQPWVFVYVAEIENKVVGMALYYYGFSTWKGRSLHLEDLIVNENYRKLGIGKALMNQVIEVAKSEKVERMSWEVLDWNEPAIKFYKSLNTQFYKDWWLCRLFKEQLEKL